MNKKKLNKKILKQVNKVLDEVDLAILNEYFLRHLSMRDYFNI